MFLVSWSLFSRLSRMKDSVSSSCKEWRGGCHPEPVERGDHHPRPPRPTPTRVSPSTPDSPCPGALASLSPLLHLLQLVFDFPPPGGSLLRGNHRSGQPCSHCPLTSLRRPLGFRPGHTHFRPRPCPPDALEAPCWEWRAEVCTCRPAPREWGGRAEAILSVAGIAGSCCLRLLCRPL